MQADCTSIVGHQDVPSTGGFSPALAEWRKLLLSSGIVRRCVPGTVMLIHDTSPKKSFLLEEGVVALTHQLNTGRQVFLAMRSPGQMFGHSRHVLNHAFELCATALTDCVIRIIDTQWLMDAIKRGGEAGLLLLRQHALDLSQAGMDLMDLMHLDASVRLERFLTQMASAFNATSSKESHAVLPLTDGYIAYLLGISPQQFSAVKRKLAKEGKIQHAPKTHTWTMSPNDAQPHANSLMNTV